VLIMLVIVVGGARGVLGEGRGGKPDGGRERDSSDQTSVHG
jgi:hypothetical protein